MRINLKDLMAISGQPGLFKYIKQGRSGIIVESLETNKRMNAHASMKVSSLEDITVFTEGEEDKPLPELMKLIYDKHNGEASIDPKTSTNDSLKKYFSEILPEYDKEKVYVSDMKKIVGWYNILQKLNMLVVEEEKKEEETETAKEETKDESKKAETKKKPAAEKKETKPKSVKAKAPVKAQPKGQIKPPAKKQTMTQKKSG